MDYSTTHPGARTNLACRQRSKEARKSPHSVTATPWLSVVMYTGHARSVRQEDHHYSLRYMLRAYFRKTWVQHVWGLDSNPTTKQNAEAVSFLPPWMEARPVTTLVRVMEAVVPEGTGSTRAQGWLFFAPAEPGTAPSVWRC